MFNVLYGPGHLIRLAVLLLIRSTRIRRAAEPAGRDMVGKFRELRRISGRLRRRLIVAGVHNGEVPLGDYIFLNVLDSIGMTIRAYSLRRE
jgi:hypothetical protein